MIHAPSYVTVPGALAAATLLVLAVPTPAQAAEGTLIINGTAYENLGRPPLPHGRTALRHA
ncbi:hypothetical protein [Streptomyces himalayensis]|uniref:Uncharacterized protein n=1 Tax=Streptomyces himalayensis subsp. himalayensis TaxID=2756131 RepID=A0A7W0ICX6_9ACTN|nr:hypothetical protein [Streptomyces himalayensis]MBA2951033.1 hypothetical protein [Streptomyces himalayensis subsp. himalayensis]